MRTYAYLVRVTWRPITSQSDYLVSLSIILFWRSFSKTLRFVGHTQNHPKHETYKNGDKKTIIFPKQLWWSSCGGQLLLEPLSWKRSWQDWDERICMWRWPVIEGPGRDTMETAFSSFLPHLPRLHPSSPFSSFSSFSSILSLSPPSRHIFPPLARVPACTCIWTNQSDCCNSRCRHHTLTHLRTRSHLY